MADTSFGDCGMGDWEIFDTIEYGLVDEYFVIGKPHIHQPVSQPSLDLQTGNSNCNDGASYEESLDSGYVHFGSDRCALPCAPSAVAAHESYRRAVEKITTNLRSFTQETSVKGPDHSIYDVETQEVIRKAKIEQPHEGRESESYAEAFFHQYMGSAPHSNDSTVNGLMEMFRYISTSFIDGPNPLNAHGVFRQWSPRFKVDVAFADVFTVFWKEYCKRSHTLLCSGNDYTEDDWKEAVNLSIGRSLFHAYCYHRDRVHPTGGWRGARELVLWVTIRLLEEQHQPMKYMRNIRDKFLDRWNHVSSIIRADPLLLERLGPVFQFPAQTWGYGLKTMSEDLRHRHIPRSLAKFTGFLLLAWTVDGHREPSLGEFGATKAFLQDLRKWEDFATCNDRVVVKRFISAVWPNRISTKAHRLPHQLAVENALGWIRGMFLESKVDKTLPASRSLMEEIMQEQCGYSLEGISLPAMMMQTDLDRLHHAPHSGIKPISTEHGSSDYYKRYSPEVSLCSSEFAILVTGAIFVAVKEFFEGLGNQFPVIFALNALIGSCTLAACFADAIQDHLLGPLTASVPARFLSMCRQQVILRVRNGVITSASELVNYLVTIPEIVDNIDLSATILHSMNRCEERMRTLGLLEMCSRSNTASVSPESGTSFSSSATPDIQVTMATSASPQSPARDPLKCRKDTTCQVTFADASGRARHEKSKHSPKRKCRHCTREIKDRSDYLKKHAKVCKGHPRENF